MKVLLIGGTGVITLACSVLAFEGVRIGQPPSTGIQLCCKRKKSERREGATHGYDIRHENDRVFDPED